MTFQCVFTTYITPLVPIVAALGAAVLVYVLGKSAYFRQKEYELITRRYLEEGIDAISRNVDRSLAEFRYNYWRALVLLRYFRDLGKDVGENLYQSPFMVPDPSVFEFWRDYRLRKLVGDEIFHTAHQDLDVFVRRSYEFFQDDLCSTVRIAVKGGKEHETAKPSKEIVDEYMEKMDELMMQRERYYVLLGALETLASVIQTERFSFKRIRKLRSHPTVQNAVAELKKHFKHASGNTKPVDPSSK